MFFQNNSKLDEFLDSEMSGDLFRYSPDGDLYHNSDSSNLDSDNSVNFHNHPIKVEPSTQGNSQYMEIQEQMYQDKLSDLKTQLAKLHEGCHPDWTKRLKRLEKLHKERLRMNSSQLLYEQEIVEREFTHEKLSSSRDFEDQKQYLREHLISELEEKQKMIDAERHNMELTGDSMELKPISTRKLRRRANEPSGSTGYGTGEKRRKPTQLSQVPYLLDEADTLEDLEIIHKNRLLVPTKSGPLYPNPQLGGSSTPPLLSYPADIRIEDGKLFYEKRWFCRGQAVFVESRTGDKFPAMICAIGSEAIWVRRTTDSSKLRIYLTQLTKGKFLLKRRAV